MHSSIHLHMGRTHSCYLPLTHKIPLSEIKKNPAALHNTSYKKKQRKKMLEGKRPDECKICWDIEDLPGTNYSDRHYRGQDCWTKPFFDEVKESKWDNNINPSYLEVSFSSACNFKCSYCNPTVSTSWLKEVNELGGYKLVNDTYLNPFWLKAKCLMPIDEEKNPYLEAFWKWPDLKKDLMFFRITGGEPLLSKETFKMLDHIYEEPLPDMELSINSNLGVSESKWQQFMEATSRIIEGKKIKHFMLHTSIDSFGNQAEYIRNGMDFKVFEKNVENYLNDIQEGSIAFTCTFNALSVVGFKRLLEWVISLRKRFYNTNRNIFIDIPHLQGPTHQSCKILTHDYFEKMDALITFMESRLDNDYGIKSAEILKMKRIKEWMEDSRPKNAAQEKKLLIDQRNFYLFFKEHDLRRGTDFLETFPEMRDFYQHCQTIEL